MPELTLRGVPRGLMTDAWWLSAATADAATDDDSRSPAAGPRSGGRRSVPALVALAAIVVLADHLFWGHAPGLSLALFATALVASVWLLTPDRPRGIRALAPAGAFALGLLPVMETVQPLSLGFLAAGTLGTSAWILLGDQAVTTGLPAAILRLLQALPALAAADAAHAGRQAAATTAWSGLSRAWTLPVTVGALFATLLSSANPIVLSWLDGIASNISALDCISPRPLFWITVAALAWPLLVPERMRHRLLRSFARPAPRRLPGLPEAAFNPASVARSLVLFNLIFAVQTALDLRYLWAGDTLPAGLTYAGYAHRGAYPLVATAILAGAFALACKPFAKERRNLAAFLMAFILQNVMLVVSSLYRLGLYVDSYGLTYLRVAAAIWMALVAGGLLLITWQVWRGRGNRWLLAANAILLAVTLYAAAFVNFAHVIAAHNLARSTAADGPQLDICYLCGLGPDAAAALRDHEAGQAATLCAGYPIATGPAIDGWRDWGFRSWRIRRYLEANATNRAVTDAGENPRRR